MTDDLRFPIGPWPGPRTLDAAARDACLDDLAALPGALREACEGLSDAQLDTPYRDGGWTLRQVVHHLADSHANGFIRHKLALTEWNPTIKPYAQDEWVELPDSALPVEVSLRLLESLHSRWVALLQGLSEGQWARPYQHPESGPQTLAGSLDQYAWHGRHHLAHVVGTRQRQGW